MRALIATALLTLLAFPCSAQLRPLEVTQAYSAGGASADTGQGVAVTDDGGIVLVGTFRDTASFGGLTLTAARQNPDDDWRDAYVVRYGPNGNALWARRIGSGQTDDFADRVAIGPDGSIYVAGSFAATATWEGGSAASLTLTTRGDLDAYLAKYTADGDLVWVQRSGGPQRDTGRAVAVDAAGNVLLGGAFRVTATFGTSTTLTSAGSADGYTAKYTSDGDLLWVRRAGSLEGDSVRGIDVDDVGNVYVVGSYRDEFGPAPNPGGDPAEIFVISYAPNGPTRWTQQIGGGGNDFGRGVTVSGPEGENATAVYVTGSFEDTLTIGASTLVSAGQGDVLVFKLLGDGTPTAAIRGGGPGTDSGLGIGLVVDPSQTTEATLYVIGIVEGAGDFGTGLTYQSQGGRDAFILSAQAFPSSSSGPLPSGLTVFGGSGDDLGESLSVGEDDGGGTLAPPIAIIGSFRNQVSLGGDVLTSVGDTDIFFGYASATTVSTELEQPDGFALSAGMPNPFAGAVSFDLALPVPATVRAEVFDVLGRRVVVLHDGSLASGSHRLTWGADAAPAGPYLIRVAVGNEVATRRVTRLR